jgi:putative transposase
MDYRTLVQPKCGQRGWRIQELAIQPDHIHFFVRAFPEDSPSQVVKESNCILD